MESKPDFDTDGIRLKCGGLMLVQRQLIGVVFQNEGK